MKIVVCVCSPIDKNSLIRILSTMQIWRLSTLLFSNRNSSLLLQIKSDSPFQSRPIDQCPRRGMTVTTLFFDLWMNFLVQILNLKILPRVFLEKFDLVNLSWYFWILLEYKSGTSGSDSWCFALALSASSNFPSTRMSRIFLLDDRKIFSRLLYSLSLKLSLQFQ